MKKLLFVLLSLSLLAIPFTPTAAESPFGGLQHTIPGTLPKNILTGSGLVSAAPVAAATEAPTPEEAVTEEATPEPVAPAATPTADPTDPNYVPTLDEFAAHVRGLGYLGIWSEGLFAFEAYGMGWGQVPGVANTASYATYETYGAYFIHDYLGGSKLYSLRAGTRVAVIRPTSIDWFVINNTPAFMGTPNGMTCGYQEPYVTWGQDFATGTKYTTLDIIHTYYSMPFAIQTCYCAGGVGGVYIVTGVWDN